MTTMRRKYLLPDVYRDKSTNAINNRVMNDFIVRDYVMVVVEPLQTLELSTEGLKLSN